MLENSNRFKFRIPMFSDKGSFMEFQYLELGDQVEETLCGHNGKVQQCTGLKDSSGKLIYEGDIISWSSSADLPLEEKGKVIWGDEYEYPAFDVIGADFDCNGLAFLFANNYHIKIVESTYEDYTLLDK